MLLVDYDIQWEMAGPDPGLRIEPFSINQLQPASVDLHLGNTFVEYDDTWLQLPIDPMEQLPSNEVIEYVVDSDDRSILIGPGEFLLAHTIETVTLGAQFAARIEGKSTLGRLGLIVHSTAGFVDPGFSGQLTLEMTNLNKRPIILRPGMRIAQLSIMKLDRPARRLYGHPALNSHYQGQTGATVPAPLSL